MLTIFSLSGSQNSFLAMPLPDYNLLKILKRMFDLGEEAVRWFQQLKRVYYESRESHTRCMYWGRVLKT